MKDYINENKLLNAIVNHNKNVKEAQKYINEKYDVKSSYDYTLSTLYLWVDENRFERYLEPAKQYILDYFEPEMLEVDMSKPSMIYENAEEVYVVYYDDGTMYNIYYDKDEAEGIKSQLEKESKEAKITIKREPISRFEK